MFDFGALPPEVNSGRMYVGAGSGPMLAAAAAWDDLATELQSTAASYGSTIESLTAGPWTGPSSIAMAAAAAPYVAWLGATGAQAEEAAGQAKVAAGAYETAFAATVPPPVVAANRALLMGLVATNFLGQNTPAIAATEAHYMEMWAQDAAAMYAYAASSATASQLMPFDEPPQTTNVAGAPTQAAAVSQAGGASGANIGTQLSQLINSLPTALQSLGSGLLNSPTSSGNLLAGLQLPQLATLPSLANWPAGLGTGLSNWNTIWGALTGTYSLQGWTAIPGGPFLSFGQAYAWGQNGQGAAAYLAGPKAISGALAPLMQGAGTPTLSSAAGAPAAGAMGKAALVGGMSVPQGWTEAAPAITTLAQVLPANAAAAPAASLTGEGVFGQMALSSLAGRAVGAAFQPAGTGGAAASSLGGAVGTESAAATIIVIPALED